MKRRTDIIIWSYMVSNVTLYPSSVDIIPLTNENCSYGSYVSSLIYLILLFFSRYLHYNITLIRCCPSISKSVKDLISSSLTYSFCVNCCNLIQGHPCYTDCRDHLRYGFFTNFFHQIRAFLCVSCRIIPDLRACERIPHFLILLEFVQIISMSIKNPRNQIFYLEVRILLQCPQDLLECRLVLREKSQGPIFWYMVVLN